jgi:hypothetical protein
VFPWRVGPGDSAGCRGAARCEPNRARIGFQPKVGDDGWGPPVSESGRREAKVRCWAGSLARLLGRRGDTQLKREEEGATPDFW